MKRKLLLVLSVLFLSACAPAGPDVNATATQDALNAAATQTAAAITTPSPLVPVTPTTTTPPLPAPPDIATQTAAAVQTPQGVAFQEQRLAR